MDWDAVRLLHKEARRVLDRNRRQGLSSEGLRFDFTCPSLGTYPFQWFWDSCFHAIVLCHFDVERAAAELRTLLSAARSDGFIPHIIFWEKDHFHSFLADYNIVLDTPFTTATIQPPVLASAVRRVYEVRGDKTFLRDLLPRVKAFYRWLAFYRDPDQDGLIAIIQPDESGMDASPKYDVALQLTTPDTAGLRTSMERLFTAYRPHRQDLKALFDLDLFNFEDVLVNSVYADGLRDLAWLCREEGETEEAATFDAAAAQTEAALIEQCYDECQGLFFDRSSKASVPVRVRTVSTLLPLLLRTLPEEIADRLVTTHLLNEGEFWLPYPVPSVAASEPSFNPGPGIVWRGPTWMNTNWLLVTGLLRHGFTDVARCIAEKSLALVLRSGFREYFNPYDGTGYGAEDFGWSTLVVDMMDKVMRDE